MKSVLPGKITGTDRLTCRDEASEEAESKTHPFDFASSDWGVDGLSRIRICVMDGCEGTGQKAMRSRQRYVGHEHRTHPHVDERRPDARSLPDSLPHSVAHPPGILASDESPSTMGKRLVKAGKENTAENRRQYRSLFYGANLGQHISGAILHPEALDMHLDDGRTFVEALHSQGIIVGVKVDEGLEPLKDGLEGETCTKGLESLDERIDSYVNKGVRFAKWRAAFRISKSPESSECTDVDHCGGQESCRWTVSDVTLKTNAEQLARYAKICLRKSVVPIVEPEILIDVRLVSTQSSASRVCRGRHLASSLPMRRPLLTHMSPTHACFSRRHSFTIQGDHDFNASLRITKMVLAECMHALVTAGVDLNGILLKPQMVSPGVDNKDEARSPSRIARYTLMALRETVPPAVKGIMFLSGGQTEYQSTVNLNYLNVVSKAYPDEFAVPYVFEVADIAQLLIWSVARCLLPLIPSFTRYALSFSFGRGLQASVLEMWRRGDSVQACMNKAEEIARVNGLAARGAFFEDGHPTILPKTGNLQETFRGVY